ncbi:MAG: hypothetical protein JSU86_13845 [Phycisphaerales bacterium]|nr:MAG: hypothetical protein JSU86_13845 [Phycisphaerales bacterium]
MRKTLFTLAVFALASPALAQRVNCDGAESSGTGANSCDGNVRMYAYPVTEEDGQDLTDVYIGTDDCDPAKYSEVCSPPGWTFAIETTTEDHYPEKTQHGALSAGPDGLCPCVAHWNDGGTGGGLPSNAFIFGFNNKEPSHDVGWRTIDALASSANEDWAKMVGAATDATDGLGPVHGPRTGVIPTVSGWGFAVMLLLIAAAGTVVIRRRAAVASA